ncbi:MAG: DUF4855 domain-containing protein [Muribaculaceae bacterium]|nr:DUF4855 domain-containing protein [Muribaculaceae bacterium]
MKYFCRPLAIAALLISALSAFAQQFGVCDDLALIWVGARHRPDWNKELFTPYIVHEFPDGHKSWLFDGFLMIDGWTNGVRREGEDYDTYINRRYTFGEAHYTPADKDMWEWFLHRQLGTYDNLACRALDDRIGELIPELGEPNYKHQVVLTLPIPYQAYNGWGKIDGKNIDFGVLSDKIAAMKWYVDLILEEWAKADFKNIELAGIYWLRESISDGFNEIACAKAMCEYAHEKDLQMFWIPYYRAPHYKDGKSYGIDMVYHQPNYVFTLDRPKEQLENSINDAYDYDMGMLIEFEGCCISGIDDGITDTRTVVPQGNSCLYEHSLNHAFYDRFVEYVDMFEDNGVFDFMPVGYYAGFQAVYDFTHSKNPKDQEIINRLASIIEQRHILGGWYDANAGIADAVGDARATVYGMKGAIYVSDFAGGKINIYSIDGRNLIQQNSVGEDNPYRYGEAIPCPAGIYIVKAGKTVTKVTVN